MLWFLLIKVVIVRYRRRITSEVNTFSDALVVHDFYSVSHDHYHS